MSTYSSKLNQSIYDVCLQTYGTLDMLVKLMTDNNISGLEDDFPAGTLFFFGETKTPGTKLQNISKTNFQQNIIYSTKYKSGGALQTDSSVNITTDSGIVIKVD